MEFFKKIFTRKIIAVVVLIDLAIATGIFAMGIPSVDAGSLLDISDKLSGSVPGATANHTVTFTTNSNIAAGKTIKITFDPETNAFDGVQNVTNADIQFTGATLVASCSPGTDNVSLSTSTAVGDESVIFTVCTGNTVASGTLTIVIGNNKLVNPASTQSYVIRIGGTMPDSGDTRVAILPAVTATAAVGTNFSFAVLGVATDTMINGVTTTGATASTSVSFGTLSPAAPEILGQELQVTTNAGNGFAVTVHEDQDLTSSGGASISVFANGNATSTPSPWTSPLGIGGQPATYGHIGVTSNDASGTLNFGTSTPLFAGSFNPTSTLTVFSWTGPADGATQNIGVASVAYKIETSPLQAAGSDYSNDLIYVATPNF